MKIAYRRKHYFSFHTASLGSESHPKCDPQSIMWHVIKNMQNSMKDPEHLVKSGKKRKINEINHYKLKEGEIIKFGRAAYRVEKIHVPKRDQEDYLQLQGMRRGKSVTDPWAEGEQKDNLANALKQHNQIAGKAEEEIKLSISPSDESVACRICL